MKMSYTIEILETQPLKLATMKMTIPDYSTDLAYRAALTLEKELKNKGIELLEERYNFMVSFDSHYRLEVIDIEVAVAVKSLGEDTEMIHFTEIENDSMLIRIVAKSFDDVHIGLAEWMHDNDYVANGILRQVIHDGIEHIYDCPVKKAED
jgi:hypothetical protein